MEYNHLEIEKKWQKKWEDEKTFKTEESSKKPKFYCLDMFPYPSGSGLHVGHPRGYSASDVFSRYKRMRGFNVLHPMGWDAFGLPAENYALKTGIHPEKSTKENIERFKKQIKSLSFSYDWSKEINTTDPSYYKWTQWIFLKLFEKGLAYEAVLPINWCPSCKTGLANEEVVGNECDRCGTQVERKNLRQWVLKITSYAERLLEDLDSLDWPEKIKEMQKNWIGKSEGADIIFTIEDEKQEYKKEIKIFTTRPDTLFGATALILSPEHPFVVENQDKFVDSKKIKDYLKKSLNKSDLERTDLAKEKTGIEITDFKAINPATKEKISIWIADYVLISYGYGAVMSVPAHDERDYDFAKKFNLEIKEVVSGGDVSKEAYIGEGVLVNSKEFNGVYSLEARKKITESLQKNKLAEPAINYKLRDWVFSRQRYWGEPIPLIHCESCGVVPVPENNLPVELPKVDQYQPTGTGESPLAALEDWVNVSCPKCGSVAKRETNTMPQWAGSCWYYLRYIDTENKNELVDLNKEKEFMPVDLYIGGAEHAVLHLLYARFWHKFLYDINRVSTKEPFLKLKNQGLILAEDGQKMSKSKGNVVSPDELIHQYGADSLRIYEMFMGPFEEPVAWNNKGLVGARRFLEKIFRVEIKDDLAESKLLHKTIKKVTEDIESFKFNTAVSSLMILINEWSKTGASTKDFNIFLKMLSCFAPCVAEELWEKNGNKKSVCLESWPSFNPSLIEEEIVVLIVQINGKVRDKISLQAGLSLNEVKEIVLEREKVKEWMKGNKTKDIIFVQDKLINIVF